MANADDVALDGILRALADPTRRRIFRTLAGRPAMTTGELARATPAMTRWGVMKHLSVLRAAGLIQSFDDGRLRRHFADEAALTPLRRWLVAPAGGGAISGS